MNTKILTILKYIAIGLFVFTSIVACEKDFENVGEELVDNGVFNTKKKDFELISYSKNIEASRVDNIEYLGTSANLGITFGIYETQTFGTVKASIAVQALIPTTDTVDWGDNPNLDAVYLEIPYSVVTEENYDDGRPKFSLDNIYGNEAVSYEVKVSKLETYLNLLDPLDPSKKNTYYSDATFTAGTELFTLAEFKPRATDTVEYFDRTMLDDAAHHYVPIQEVDSIKRTDVSPFIKFRLNHDFFKTNFIENPIQTQFDNEDAFIEFFRGLLIEVEGTGGSILSLDFSEASLKLYYTNTEDETEDETTVDLNGDGDTDDTDVTYPVRTKQIMSFPLYGTSRGIRTNAFVRDYSGSAAEIPLTNPNTTEGEKKLYIQGAQGSLAVLDLFKDVDLTELRNKNWLINEASLTFYVDQGASGEDVPEKLLLYVLDTDETNNINEDVQISDAVEEASYLGGLLVKDGDTPLKYKINITDYITNVLKEEDFIDPVKLGVKPFYFTDLLPDTILDSDLIVKDYSWDPRGVVLYGNDYVESDVDYNKRMRLEIHYTELNE